MSPRAHPLAANDILGIAATSAPVRGGPGRDSSCRCQTKALSPVMARPTINDWIESVPS